MTKEKKKTFRVPVKETSWGELIIIAKTKEEAQERLDNIDYDDYDVNKSEMMNQGKLREEG